MKCLFQLRNNFKCIKIIIYFCTGFSLHLLIMLLFKSLPTLPFPVILLNLPKIVKTCGHKPHPLHHTLIDIKFLAYISYQLFSASCRSTWSILCLMYVKNHSNEETAITLQRFDMSS